MGMSSLDEFENTSQIERNADCFCAPLERARIETAIHARSGDFDLAADLADKRTYFANTAVFVSQQEWQQMAGQIKAIESVLTRPNVQHKALKRAGLPTQNSPITGGVFMGYDFHMTADGPRLIEINTNAGGAGVVSAMESIWGQAQLLDDTAINSIFDSEWKNAGHSTPLETIAIVDTDPPSQYHYPDMCLIAASLERSGKQVFILDPSQLRAKTGALWHLGNRIDLVYNRLTDFNFSELEHSLFKDKPPHTLISPSAADHAVFAEKSNLITLTTSATLAALGIESSVQKTLAALPKTVLVTPENAGDLWKKRKQYFFKPTSGFGSRAVYSGVKLTHKTWDYILQGGYVAQSLVAPPLRAVIGTEDSTRLKFDIRAYTYRGEILTLAARMYRGQTTNMRTIGGGLAPVIRV